MTAKTLPRLAAAAALAVLAALTAPRSAEAARVLAVFPTRSRSHNMAVRPLVRALGARGHHVDVFGCHPPAADEPNVHFTMLEHEGGMIPGFNVTMFDNTLLRLMNPIILLGTNEADCKAVFSNPAIQEMIRSDTKYDLILTELFNTDCNLAFGHRFQAPVVAISTSGILPWGHWRFGNPENPAFVPNIFLGYTDEMALVERTVNALFGLYAKLAQRLYFEPLDQALIDEAFGPGQPPVRELARNTSLLFINTFHALSLPRPLATNVVEVGGIHIAEDGPQPLPQDLEQFVSGAKDGVILFSLGSMIRTSSLPRESAAGLLRALGSLKQRVVWKWEDEAPGPVPANVRLSKWLPQFDVLCHNNTRLFIGHGGLLSTTEAAHCGVPLLGFAMYGDQRTNLAAVSKIGAGRAATYSTLLNADLFLKNVKDLLEDPSYRDNAKVLSKRFRDRPMSPLETAVFWTEYVIRHRGAPHLRGAARHLAWYQEALLDVAAVVALAVAAALGLLWMALRALLALLRLACSLAGSNKAANKKKQA